MILICCATVMSVLPMGNSSDEVKAVADIVTDDIKEDGLKNAMVHLGLV